MAGVTRRTVYDLREAINHKLASTLGYYDSNPHGDLLSRVTNDVDMVSQTLQQGLTQLVTSAVTLIGVIIMMLRISPLLTLITMLMLPLSAAISAVVVSRSQGYFAGQQRWLGELNGHVEEMYTGHTVVKAYDLEEKALAEFDEKSETLRTWLACAVYIRVMMPLIGFVGNLGYVAISVVGGIFALRSDHSRRHPGLHAVFAPVHDAHYTGCKYSQHASRCCCCAERVLSSLMQKKNQKIRLTASA